MLTINYISYDKIKTPLIILLAFFTFSCSGVQDYVFPHLSEDEVAAPPALEEVQRSCRTSFSSSCNQEIPPSQYAPPMAPQPQSGRYNSTGTFVGGKINQFRGDLTSIQNAGVLTQ